MPPALPELSWSWEREIDNHLEKSGGKLAWDRLRDAVVSVYLKSAGGTLDQRTAGLHVLANIPTFCLSKKSPYVRSIDHTMAWHAKKFLKHRDPAILLAKYANFDGYKNRAVLLRHACHVSSWVVKLPEDDVMRRHRGNSPLTVLVKLLQGRRRGPLTSRLNAILSRVGCRIAEMLESSVLCDSDRSNLQALQSSLPRVERKRKHAESLKASMDISDPGVDSRSTAELVRTITVERDGSLNLADQLLAAEDLQSRARCAQLEGNVVMLGELFINIVACLGAPKATGQESSNHRMDDDAKGRLRAGVQRILRDAILICLRGILRNPKAFQSPAVTASLEYVKSLVDSVDLSQVTSAKQWASIHALVTSRVASESSLSDCKRSYDRTATEGSCIQDGVYTPNPRVRALQFVVHKPGQGKLLTCPSCHKEVLSEFFFVIPGKRPQVLRPDNGHLSCATIAADGHLVRTQYITVDGSESCGDKYYNLSRKSELSQT